MSNSIYYKRIPGSTIQGNATSVTEPYGTLVVTNNNDLRLHDGNTAGGLGVHTDSDWVNPNERTWQIRTYNDGAAVAYDGTTPVKWFDIDNCPYGTNNFRGAIIEYHAYVGSSIGTNPGTIIGTIHLANDYYQGEATHTEHMSGENTLQAVSLWETPDGGNRGQLFFKRTDSIASTLMIQWTAKIFYGYEASC